MEGEVDSQKTVNSENLVEKSLVTDLKNKSGELLGLKNQGSDLTNDVSLGIAQIDEDDDNVSVDGLGKESDGNIDEDELLKDTEADKTVQNDTICCAEEEAFLESNSDNSNALQPLSKITAVIEKQGLSNLDNAITKLPEEINENTRNDTVERSFSEGILESQPEVDQSEENPCDLQKGSDGKSLTDTSRNLDNKTIETDVLPVESDLQTVKSSSSVFESDCDSKRSSVNNAENRDEQSTDSGIQKVVINKYNTTKEPVDSEGVRINDMEENEDATTFLHVDQEDNRPDECVEGMELSGEDPFAQTAEDSMNNIGIDQTNPSNNDSTIDIDQVSDDSNKEVADGVISMDVDENINKDNTEVDCTSDNSSSSSAMKVIENSTLIESVQMNNSTISTGISSVTSLSVVDNEAISNKQNISDKCLESESSTVTSSQSASQNKHIELNQNENTLVSNGQESEESVQNERNDQSLKNSENNHLCIVPDKDVQQNQEPNTATLGLVASCKTKTGKILIKTSKAKSKKNISDESSDDSDFEVTAKTPSRPKRDAAKKAETQIKQVLSAAENEQDVELVEYGSNNGDNSDLEEVASQDSTAEDVQTCFVCKKVGPCKINVLSFGKLNHFCNQKCFETFKGPVASSGECLEISLPSLVFNDLESADIQLIDRSEFVRKCSKCTALVKYEDEKTLSWETMDFCSEDCLGDYQQELGSHCANCKGNVQSVSLGKYCVRFGYEIKQFCCSSCLEEFKKGLKVCSFCQKDISSGAEGFLAPVGDKGTFKDFCTQACMEKYEQMSSNQRPPKEVLPCDVCANNKPVEVQVFFDSKVNKLCSDICFSAYKFANKLSVDRCDMCKKYFDKDAHGEKFNIFYDDLPHNFCCKTCMNVYILAKRKIVPCNWCKVKKYNFDMIKRVQSSGQVLMMCSLNCLTLYQVSVNAVSSRRIKCDMCMSVAQAQYHLTMSDATIRNFCTYPCVMNFQQQYGKVPISLPPGEGPPIPTGAPKRIIHKNDVPGGPVPIISSVTSLVNGPSIVSSTTSLAGKLPSGKPSLVTRLLEPPTCRNKNTQTRPLMNSKSISCRPHTNSEYSQTDDSGANKILIPIPVPIFIPCPMAMYSFPFPVPIPFAVPVPVPIFLPTTRNSIKGIVKEIKFNTPEHA